MAFKRVTVAETLPVGDEATSAYVAIGMGGLEATPSAVAPNIEDTLVAASREGMDEGDARVLGLLVDWISVHGERINAARLVQLVECETSLRVRAFWTAIAQWCKKDYRLARLRSLYTGPPVDYLPTGTDFDIKRRGEDPRFAGSTLRVARGTLRERPEHITSPEQLARQHRGYRCRLLMGASFRADMWALLDMCPSLSCAELARRAYGSHQTARLVRRDWRMLAAADHLQQTAPAAL